MKIKYNGQEYPVITTHDKDFVRRSEFTNKAIVVGRTISTVTINGKNIRGISECSILDSFNEEFGEKIAVGRIKKELKIPRE